MRRDNNDPTSCREAGPSAPGRAAAVLALCGTLLLATGCSSFHREWRAAARQPAPAHSLEGRWEGTWHSEANGHTGRLRCLIKEPEDGRYRARFHAKFLRILSFGYAARLDATEQAGRYRFQGQAVLPKWAGGAYRYEGHATATNFFSTYRCARDHGTFEMTRPK
ncbi:MAG: hypothetical protein HYY24_04725 [Verrucomicrobia bacterium]|nr:hypothetical protein [Verrucomicrobiota bacterium]